MTGSRTLRHCGEDAVLVEVADLAEVLDLAAAVRRAAAERRPGFEEVVDVVPAAVTVLVTVVEGTSLRRLRETLTVLAVTESSGAPVPGRAVLEIPVRYDGPDLAEVAARTGLTTAEVVTAHTATDWQVAFGGFAPGFAYLVGGDRRLRVPRRPEPRTAVPAGAVGLAGEYSAVYPRSSPGGWQLVGRTDVPVWDVERDPPALLQPGTLVRFVDAGGR